MLYAVQPPTESLVHKSAEKFDQENSIVERALQELFRMFPTNDDVSHVLLKVVALNRLYSTQILAVLDVAIHIQQNSAYIDAALASGSPEVVDKISQVTIQGKTHNFFSFATKYCNWHKPESYPIYDSRVDWYLWNLQNQSPFTSFFLRNSFENYSEFRDVMIAFRQKYGLEHFTFKDIDKFLWTYGIKAATVVPAGTVAESE